MGSEGDLTLLPIQDAMPPFVPPRSTEIAADTVDPSGTRIISVDASLGIEIPAGATSDWLVLVHYPAPPDQLVDVPDGLSLAFPVVNLSTSNADGLPVVLAEPATLVLQYSDEELAAAGLDEGTLVVRIQDPITGTWSDVIAVVDPVRNQIVLETTVLGPLEVLAASSGLASGDPALVAPIEEPASSSTEGVGDLAPAEGSSDQDATSSLTDSTEASGPDGELTDGGAPPEGLPPTETSDVGPGAGGEREAVPVAAVERIAAPARESDRRADWSGAEG